MFYEGKSFFMLGHGSLAKYFSGEDEFGVDFVHVFSGFFEHEDSAVDARVHVSTVSVFRVLYHINVGFAAGDYFEGYVELSGDSACFVLAAFAGAGAEWSYEVYDGNIDVLVEHHFYGKGAVKTAGEES